MCLGLKLNTTLPEDQSSVPSVCTRQLTTACKSSSKKSDTIIWSPQAPACVCVCVRVCVCVCVRVRVCAHVHTHIRIIIITA